MAPALFTIGRFSRIVRLSVKSLRRYDAMGLLRPVHVDPVTGYRRYALDQVSDAEAIRVLRELDVPLAEIVAILGERADRAAVVARLEAHLDRLEATVRAHRRRVERVEALLAQDDPIPRQPVSERHLEARPVASRRFHTSHATVAADVAEQFGTLAAALAAAGVEPAGDPRLILHAVIDEATEGDLEVAIPVERAVLDSAAIPGVVLPPYRVIETRHRGSMEDIAVAYHVLAAWSTAHGLVAAGPPCEVFRNDPSTVGPAGLEVDVRWPVRRARSEA